MDALQTLAEAANIVNNDGIEHPAKRLRVEPDAHTIASQRDSTSHDLLCPWCDNMYRSRAEIVKHMYLARPHVGFARCVTSFTPPCCPNYAVACTKSSGPLSVTLRCRNKAKTCPYAVCVIVRRADVKPEEGDTVDTIEQKAVDAATKKATRKMAYHHGRCPFNDQILCPLKISERYANPFMYFAAKGEPKCGHEGCLGLYQFVTTAISTEYEKEDLQKKYDMLLKEYEKEIGSTDAEEASEDDDEEASTSGSSSPLLVSEDV